jgi:hypothetical protein
MAVALPCTANPFACQDALKISHDDLIEQMAAAPFDVIERERIRVPARRSNFLNPP